jgi:hypothetical protein
MLLIQICVQSHSVYTSLNRLNGLCIEIMRTPIFSQQKFVTPQNGGFTRTFWLFPDFCGKEFPEEFRAFAGSLNWVFFNFNNFNDTLGELV